MFKWFNMIGKLIVMLCVIWALWNGDTIQAIMFGVIALIFGQNIENAKK